MKWTKYKQKIDKSDWHLWFAWRPVVVEVYPDGNVDKVWMKTVLRRLVYHRPERPGMEGVWIVEHKERPTQDDADVFPIPFRGDDRIDTSTLTNTKCVTGMYFSLSEDYTPPEPKVGLDMTGEGLDHQTRLYTPPEDCNECGRPLPEIGECPHCYEEECKHENEPIEKMGGSICRDCGTVLEPQHDRLTIPLKEVDSVPCYHGFDRPCPLYEKEERHKKVVKAVKEVVDDAIEADNKQNLHKPEAMKEAFRVTMTGEGLDHQTRLYTPPEDEPKHEIDIAWEVKNARRNKTIM